MSELDRYLDDLGLQLEQARPRPRAFGFLGHARPRPRGLGFSGHARPRPRGLERTRRRPRPRRRGIVLAVTGALALVAALIVTLAGGGGDVVHRAVPVGPVDAMAKARAALTVPPGEMLHMRIRTDVSQPKRSSIDELWAASDPPRWRQTFTTSAPTSSTSAFGAGVSSFYDRETNTLKRITGYADDSPQAKVRSVLGTGDGDPSEDLRAALEKGKLVDAGEQQVNGRTVRRLVSKDKDDPKTLIVLIYDVDPQTFAPVGGERIYYIPAKRKGGPRRDAGPPIRFTVEVYERVPIDPRKFEVPTNAKTKVVTITKEEFMRRFRAARRWDERCSKLRRDNPRADCGVRPTT